VVARVWRPRYVECCYAIAGREQALIKRELPSDSFVRDVETIAEIAGVQRFAISNISQGASFRSLPPTTPSV